MRVSRISLRWRLVKHRAWSRRFSSNPFFDHRPIFDRNPFFSHNRIFDHRPIFEHKHRQIKIERRQLKTQKSGFFSCIEFGLGDFICLN